MYLSLYNMQILGSSSNQGINTATETTFQSQLMLTEDLYTARYVSIHKKSKDENNFDNSFDFRGFKYGIMKK